MAAVTIIFASWMGINLALPAWLLWQRSPHLRHQVYHFAAGFVYPPHEREWAHLLVETGRHDRQDSDGRCTTPR